MTVSLPLQTWSVEFPAALATPPDHAHTASHCFGPAVAEILDWCSKMYAPGRAKMRAPKTEVSLLMQKTDPLGIHTCCLDLGLLLSGPAIDGVKGPGRDGCRTFPRRASCG